MNRDRDKSEVRLYYEPASSSGAFWLRATPQRLHRIKHGEIATALTKINAKQLLLCWSGDSEEIRRRS